MNCCEKVFASTDQNDIDVWHYVLLWIKIYFQLDLYSGMEYSDSDVYCTGNTSSLSETLGPPRYPMTATAKRSLEDRVRDYTGHTLRHDERMENPAGSSSGRSSDSRSPFLDSHTRGKKRGGGRDMMLQEREYETPHIPTTLRGDTIWETKLDQGNKYWVIAQTTDK